MMNDEFVRRKRGGSDCNSAFIILRSAFPRANGGAGMLVIYGVANALSAAWLDPLYTVDLVFDDAYYYLQNAYNIANGSGSSFDGIIPTNGYQPLWMAILAALETALRLDKKRLVAVVILLCCAIALGSVIYSVRRVRGPLGLALGVGLLASYVAFPAVSFWGLETILLAPVLPFFAVIAQADGQRRRERLTSVLLAYMVTVRLDALSIGLGYTAIAAWERYRAEGLRAAMTRGFVYLMPSALFLVLYAGFNVWLFSTPLPVSGLAKSVGAPYFSNWGIGLLYLAKSPAVLGLGAFVFLIELYTKAYRKDAFFYRLVCAVTLSVIIQYLYYACFSGMSPWGWYFYSYSMLFALLAARVVYIGLSEMGGLPALASRTLFAALIVTVVIPGFYYGSDLFEVAKESINDAVYFDSFGKRNVQDLRSERLAGRPLTIAMGDRSGSLGYWAPEGVRVFQTEGLVSSIDYLLARKHGSGEDWIAREIHPDLLLVDRGRVPLLGDPGSQQYVVVEPIQGRTTNDSLMMFCFPPAALIHSEQTSYESKRMLFDMRLRQECAPQNRDAISSIITGEAGIRRFSLPGEY